MTTAPTPITFIVRGQSQTAPTATRGRGSGSSAGFGGRGQTLQRVQVGATRGSSDAVRLTARPGLDAVVLHITNGPSLMLHPETARDLMLAQSSTPRSRAGAAATNADINVPAQLGWPGLEQAGASRGTSRGRLGDVLLSAVEVVTGLLLEPASRITAAKIAARVDNQVEAGLYPLSAQSFATALKGNGQRIASLPSPTPADAPLLVLLHGTFSETHGTFGKLWQHHPNKVRELFTRYGNRVYGFDHPTLTASPIDNALLLARSLPDGARLHLLTHSRGGLVAEVLARVCARPELDEKSLAPFKAPDHRNQLKALRELAAELKGRDIRVERVVRVACPARGTLLASKRLDAYVSVLKWSLELAAIPVAPTLIDFIGEVASQRTDPALMPGLECMLPQSPLVQWLHASEGADAGPLPGQLRVVAGDIQGDSITSWVKTLLADAFYWTDNDLVVQTRSMYGGTPRAPAGGHAAATFVLERGGKVTHFSYFSEPRSAEAICNALVQDAPAGFLPIGPMSWAGSSSDGLRGLPRSSTTPPASDRPAVILLPGILGSHLAVDGKRIWLSARILGGLGRLAYPDSGGQVLPDGASLQRTQKAGESFQAKLVQDPSVARVFVIAGNDIIGGGLKTNAGTIFIPLKDWDERKESAEQLAKKFTGLGMGMPDGMALVFNPPPIRGLGSAGGFEFYVQSKVQPSPQQLAEVVGGFTEALRKQPKLTGINTFFRPTAPQLYVEVDEAKALSLGIPISDVYLSLQATMGTLYVNDFNLSGRTYRVQLQADAQYRAQPTDLGQIYVRADNGSMVPVSALIQVTQIVGPEQLERFNGFLAAKVLGNGVAGVSSGEAIQLVQDVANASLPPGYELAWSGQAYQQIRTGTTSAVAFVFGLLMVFLILAAQYERWSLPIAVLLAVPFALFGALLAVYIRGMPNDIYFQIGLIVLVGLSAKNAILIVEFAAQKRQQGMSHIDAALTAARQRFRPIVMTSLAFILGVFPLVISSGAGAAARRSMGTGVFGGMVASTVIATIFIPMFFTWVSRKQPKQVQDTGAVPASADAPASDAGEKS